MLVTDFLEHHGVKGMRWGVRKANSESSGSSGDRHAEKRAELVKTAEAHEKLSVANAHAAAKYAGEQQELRTKGFQSAAAKRVYGDHAASQGEWEFYGQNRMGKAQALSNLDNNLTRAHNMHARAANHHSAKAARLRSKAAKLEHSEYNEIEEFLEHHGVKGMKWGEHHARRQARADANEFAKARAFYGQGAGTRRKLIKAKVQTRMSNPHYKDEFNKTLAGQNLEKRQAQATRLRRRRDVTGFAGKTIRGVHRQLTGGFGPVTATAAAVAAGAGYAHKLGLDKAALDKVKSVATSRKSQEATKAWLRSQGVSI